MQSILFCRDGLSQIYSWTDLQEFRKKKTAGEPGHPVKSIKCVVLWGELYIMNYVHSYANSLNVGLTYILQYFLL